MSLKDRIIYHWLVLLTLVSTFLFIFSRTSGKLASKLDDIFILAHTYVGTGGYLEVMAVRGYLTRFYGFVYDLMGQDMQRTYWFFWLLLLVSALLFHAMVRGWMSRRAALVGTLLYIAYAGKEETVTWISAGGYLVVLIALFISVLIATRSHWNPLGQGGLDYFAQLGAVASVRGSDCGGALVSVVVFVASQDGGQEGPGG